MKTVSNEQILSERVLVLEFRKLYWHYVKSNYSRFRMKEPKNPKAPKKSLEMRNEHFKEVIFYHYFKGYVRMSFCNHSGFEDKIKEAMPNNSKFEKTKKRLNIKMETERIDMFKSFDEQLDLVDTALKRLDDLRQWAFEVGLHKLRGAR